MHSDPLAGKLLHFVLMIEIVCLPGRLILQHVVVALLYDGAAECLNSIGRRC